MNKKKIFKQILNSQKNVRIDDFIAVLEAFGFRTDRINGSHHIFIHKTNKCMISIQSNGKEAKPYQIKQFLAMVEQHKLIMEEN